MMSYLIRKPTRADVSQIEKLLAAYMSETYKGTWGGNAERLEQDLFDGIFEMLVAENNARQIIGFIAWTTAYDLHWCLKGGDIIDFYVLPEKRGRGIGLLLAVELAAEIQRRGGKFLKGGAVENEAVRRFYGRIAMLLPNGDCYLSGRAFRHFAGLSEKSVREVIRNLPETDWNYQA
jgi:GNAT superfamily N-acetyltransferase